MPRSIACIILILVLAGCTQPPPGGDVSPSSTSTTPSASTSTTTTTTPVASSPSAPSPTTSTPTQPTPSSPPPGPSCVGDPDVIFPSPFTNASLLDHIAPIGDPGGGTMSRSYVSVRGDVPHHTWPMVPVIAPVNMTLTGVVFAHKQYGADQGRDEYRLEFQVTCEVRLWFDHVAQVRPDIAALWTGPSVNASNIIQAASLAVHAGDELGRTNGTFIAGTWDFAVFNTAHPAPHANASRWLSEHDTIAECPYTHFEPALRATYFALLVAKDQSHTNDCRSPSRDINGTLSGGWFQGDSTDAHPPWFEVASDGPGLAVIRIIGADGRLYNLRQDRPTKLPENVHAGETTCYSDGQTYVWMTLESDARLRVARGAGACPATMPADAESWLR